MLCRADESPASFTLSVCNGMRECSRFLLQAARTSSGHHTRCKACFALYPGRKKDKLALAASSAATLLSSAGAGPSLAVTPAQQQQAFLQARMPGDTSAIAGVCLLPPTSHGASGTFRSLMPNVLSLYVSAAQRRTRPNVHQGRLNASQCSLSLFEPSFAVALV